MHGQAVRRSRATTCSPTPWPVSRATRRRVRRRPPATRSAHLVVDQDLRTATVDSKPGDTVTYTVTATNDGPGEFTAVDPATVVDDLTGVLDDADLQQRRHRRPPGARPTYAAPRITWSGALASNDTVTITYTVVLKGGGDGVVRNVAWQPVDPGNPGADPGLRDHRRSRVTPSSYRPAQAHRRQDREPREPAGHRADHHLHRGGDQPGPGRLHRRPPGDVHRRPVRRARRRDAGSALRPTTTGTASITGTDAVVERCARGRARRRRSPTPSPTGPPVTTCSTTPRASRSRRHRCPAEACDTVSVPGSGLVHAQVGRSGVGYGGRGRRRADLHADLRQHRRPDRGDRRHQRRPDRRARRRHPRSPARSTAGGGLTATPTRSDANRDRGHRLRPGRCDPDGDLPGHGQAVRPAGRPRHHQRARL